MNYLKKRGRSLAAFEEEGDDESEYENFPGLSLDEYLIYPEVEQRYSAFKTARFDPKKLKKFINTRYDLSISDDSLLILTTSMKVFVGEVVERARELMTKASKGGPISPDVLSLAHMQVTKEIKGDLFRSERHGLDLV